MPVRFPKSFIDHADFGGQRSVFSKISRGTARRKRTDDVRFRQILSKHLVPRSETLQLTDDGLRTSTHPARRIVLNFASNAVLVFHQHMETAEKVPNLG